MLRYPVPRNHSHATVVACIAADGTSVKPLVIVQEVTVRQTLILKGWTKRKAVFAHTDTGYVNRDAFHAWLRGVFVPEVARRRLELGLPDQRGFLLMDNCSAHTDRAVVELLERNNITPVFIPPHGSHVFQPLDRCMFAAFKQKLRTAVVGDFDKQTRRLLKILDSWEKATKTNTLLASFELSGFVYQVHDEDIFITFIPRHVDLPEGVQLPTAQDQHPPRQPVRSDARDSPFPAIKRRLMG